MNKLIFWLCIVLIVTLTFCCETNDITPETTVVIPDDDFIMLDDETIVSPFSKWNSEDEVEIWCKFEDDPTLHRTTTSSYIGFLTGAIRAQIITDVNTEETLTGALDSPSGSTPRAHIDRDIDGIGIGTDHVRYQMLPEQLIYTAIDNGRYVSYIESAVFCNGNDCITVSMRLTCQ